MVYAQLNKTANYYGVPELPTFKQLVQLLDRANFGRYSSRRYVVRVAQQLIRLAHTGDAQAQYHLGMLYWIGWGVDQDRSTALQLLQAAAGAGSGSAAFHLGVAYDNGKGVAKSYYRAFYWHSKAALLGCVKSMHCVGSFYYWSQGVEQDYTKAKY